MHYIGRILPVEGYYVQLKDSPPVDFAKSLTHLYQPLIGLEAIMLYQTLLHEIDLQTHDKPVMQTHHTLMNYLDLPLDTIYEARLKLEAIGLLKTYEHQSNGHRAYIYILQSPYAPEHFFQDVMLTELLYHHLGQAKYDLLQNRYARRQNIQLGKEITASFSDVFGTIQPALTVENQSKVVNEHPKGPQVEQIDFSWLETMLQQRMISVENVLTEDNKNIISTMTFLYDLEPNQVEKAVLWALNEENRLDVTEFKEACHDIFKTKRQQTPIALQLNQHEKQEEVKLPQSKEEQLIARLQTISPKELLEDLSSGKQASEQDMKLIRDVMTEQGLPTPVMNVLIHFVLLQTNMKLSKAYLEKIASHWSRANLTTAKEAMQFAKKEVHSLQKNKRQPKRMTRSQSKEVIPDWFKERQKQSNNHKSKQPQKLDPQSEKERQELAALIRQYAGE